MIRKILITIFLFTLITSCGKKGDPVYNGKKLNIKNTKNKVVL